MGPDNKIVLTYEVIYDILLREKQREELQKIDPGFWRDTLAYLREKQAMLDETRHKVDLFSAAEREKTQTQLRNIRRLLRSVYDLREKKILDIAVNKSRTNSKIIDVSNMLDVERQLFESLVSEMNFFRQGLLNNILELRNPSMLFEGQEAALAREGRTLPAPSLPAGQVMVMMARDVAQFVGPELEVYGPFRSGEAAVLPEAIAAILVSQGAAALQAAQPVDSPGDNHAVAARTDEYDSALADQEDNLEEMDPVSSPDVGTGIPGETDGEDVAVFPEQDIQADIQDIPSSEEGIPQ